MLRALADEDFRNAIVAAIRREGLEILRVQDVGLAQTPDPAILAWASANGTIVVSHDVSTMTRHAWDRVRQGLPFTGLLVIAQSAPLGPVVQELGSLLRSGDFADFTNDPVR